MLKTLLEYLRQEERLLAEMIILAEMQKEALVSYKVSNLELITIKQDKINFALKDIEEQRIKLLMQWLEISRKEASNLKLSSIEKNLKGDAMLAVKKLRLSLAELYSQLNNLNTTNKMLATKARQSTQQIMSLFTSGVNHVCNVTV